MIFFITDEMINSIVTFFIKNYFQGKSWKGILKCLTKKKELCLVALTLSQNPNCSADYQSAPQRIA